MKRLLTGLLLVLPIKVAAQESAAFLKIGWAGPTPPSPMT